MHYKLNRRKQEVTLLPFLNSFLCDVHGISYRHPFLSLPRLLEVNQVQLSKVTDTDLLTLPPEGVYVDGGMCVPGGERKVLPPWWLKKKAGYLLHGADWGVGEGMRLSVCYVNINKEH